ncbi:MAG: molybdopterin-binding protein [Planctomycetota bacterium]|nr:molybdopterin-binding protein [Planctomycetota bacterium]
MANETFGLLCIGNELLSGKVAETNLAYWIQEFKKLGRRVTVAIMAPDERSLLVDTIRFIRQNCDILLMSGGIGPTHDDFTLPVLAEALNKPLVRYPELVEAIEGYYGENTNSHLLSMADLPEGTELLYWDQLLVPLFRVEQIYVFPGAPNLLRKKFSLLAKDLSSIPNYVHKIYTTFDEGVIAGPMEQIEQRFPGVYVGSYPRYDPGADYRVLVTMESKDKELLQRAYENLMTQDFQSGVLRVNSEEPKPVSTDS